MLLLPPKRVDYRLPHSLQQMGSGVIRRCPLSVSEKKYKCRKSIINDCLGEIGSQKSEIIGRQAMDWNVIYFYLPRYRDALLLTLRVGCQGVAFSLLLGILCAVVLYLKIPVLQKIVRFYIELFRNTPLLVQLFFLYFALPKIGISIAPAVCGTLGLGLLGGAYMAETFRSGLESIASVQTESAESLGMNRLQVFFYVVLPQTVRSSVPGVVANVIFLLKETSVFSTISLMDLMFTAKDLIGMYAKTIECLAMLVVFYLIMLLPVSILGSILERRLRYAEFGD